MNSGDFGEKKEFEDFEIQEEGSLKFQSFPHEKYAIGKTLSKSMPVFYNPIQEMNRSLSLLVFLTYRKYQINTETPFEIMDIMAASGVRALRILKEFDNNLLIHANDLNPLALRLIKNNYRLNQFSSNKKLLPSFTQNLQEIQQHPEGNMKTSEQKSISSSELRLYNEDARYLMEQFSHYNHLVDIIDIDPFGTPNVFMEAALRTIKIGGIMGVTATDTTVLFGIKPLACLRKYNTNCLRSSFQKEVGLRILLYFCAIRAHPLKNAIRPILSVSFNHYVRVFIQILRGKEEVNKNLANFGYIQWCGQCDWRHSFQINQDQHLQQCPECGQPLQTGGPLWIGKLHNQEFVDQLKKKILKTDNIDKERIPSLKKIEKVLERVIFEDNYPVGYYNLHKLADKLTVSITKMEIIMQEIEKAGFQAARTHIEPKAIKTNMPLPQIKDLLVRLDPDFEKHNN